MGAGYLQLARALYISFSSLNNIHELRGYVLSC